MQAKTATNPKPLHFGLIMVIYLCGIFMGAIDTSVVTPARTVIQNGLGVGDQTGIWMITIYTLAYASSIPIMGKLADRLGRKTIYLICIILFGTGSLLAFPGSMIGACLAGLCYSRFGSVKAAMAGEIFGTGILGGLTAWVIARFFLNSAAAAWFFIPPFLISTVGGSIIAGLIIKSGILAYALPNLFANKGNKSNL